MRVIGGIYRSRLINMPKGIDIRPTQDKVRGAVFNMLGDINGANVLDLFAGSGAFGIEALSRGASGAVFVDDDARCVKTIEANLRSLEIDPARYNIIKCNGIKAPERLQRAGERFDLIFLDPPYYKDIARNCLINIDACDILTKTCRVVVEHFKKDALDFEAGRLVIEKERLYGDTAITIFRI